MWCNFYSFVVKFFVKKYQKKNKQKTPTEVSLWVYETCPVLFNNKLLIIWSTSVINQKKKAIKETV